MRFEKDFEDFLRSLNEHDVRYCIIGAFPVGFHGYPRYTKDIDILIDSSREDAEKVVKALRAFGIKSRDITEEDFLVPGRIIQLGYEPIRIDLLTPSKKGEFPRTWLRRVGGAYGGEKAPFIGLDDPIGLKKAAKRPQDILDVAMLLKRKRTRPAKRRSFLLTWATNAQSILLSHWLATHFNQTHEITHAGRPLRGILIQWEMRSAPRQRINRRKAISI